MDFGSRNRGKACPDRLSLRTGPRLRGLLLAGARVTDSVPCLTRVGPGALKLSDPGRQPISDTLKLRVSGSARKFCLPVVLGQCGVQRSYSLRARGLLPPRVRNSWWFRELCSAFQAQNKCGSCRHVQDVGDRCSFRHSRKALPCLCLTGVGRHLPTGCASGTGLAPKPLQVYSGLRL